MSEIVSQVNELPEFIEDILSMGLVDGFMSLSVVRINNEKKYNFDEKMYKALETFNELTITESLNLMKKVFKVILSAEEILLFLDDYIITDKNLFLDYKKENIKIKYEYSADNKDSSKNKIIGIIKIFEKKINDAGIKYVENLIEYGGTIDYDLKLIEKEIDKMLMEIEYCQVE